MNGCARESLAYRAAGTEAFKAGARSKPAAHRLAGKLDMKVNGGLTYTSLDNQSRRGCERRIEKNAEGSQRDTAIGGAALLSIRHGFNQTVSAHPRPLDPQKISREVETGRAIRRQG